MHQILKGNNKSITLLNDLWEFFEFRIGCIGPEERDEPSTNIIYLDSFLRDKTIISLKPTIRLRQSPRIEEALVHELLHLNLIPLGFPKYRLYDPGDVSKRSLAKGILNNADHTVMRPIYLEFGYEEDKFFGPSKKHTDVENEVITHLSNLEKMKTPELFSDHVGDYLRENGITFREIYVKEEIKMRDSKNYNPTSLLILFP